MGEILFCNRCGMANAPGALFCSSCGASMNPAATAAPAPVAGTPYPAPAAAHAPAAAYQAATAAGVRYGGFWIRVVATIIDAILVRVVVAPVGVIFGIGSGLAGMAGGFGHGGLLLHLLGGGVMLVLILAGSWLYEAFMESSSYQATLGKMVFGMKVTDLKGNRISFERATGRHFAKYLSSMILGIGYIMVGFTERKQGLHDLLAGTLVRIA
jgi:uncharacterized RDD family membrane protein YckC